jgi:A118 family predicted phage portal protein
MNLPAVVCYDVARLAVSEAQVSTNDDIAQDVLDRLIIPNIQHSVEQAMATGDCVLRPWIDTGGTLHLDTYHAQDFLPVRFQDNQVIAGVFVQRKVEHPTTETTVTWTKLELQDYDANAKTIHVVTKVFRLASMPMDDLLGTEYPIDSVPEWGTITPDYYITNASRPLFVFCRSQWLPKACSNGALGASIFADAVDQVKELNDRINQLSWEFESGKRKLIVDESAIPTDDQGKESLSASDSELYRKLSGSATAEATIKDLFADFSPEIRVDNYLTDIKRLCSEIALLCHMDSGYLSYDQTTGAVTATQVKVQDKKSYATVCNTQSRVAQPTVEALLRSFSMLLYASGKPSYDADEVIEDAVFSWGDGLMTDPDAEQAQALLEVQSGLRSKESYLREFRGLDEDAAAEEIAAIKGDTPVVESPLFGA